MTLDKDRDPGWWRRGMSQRGFTIIVIVCVAIIVAAITFAVASGIPFF
jgi:Tfp pilus assembly protein PilX